MISSSLHLRERKSVRKSIDKHKSPLIGSIWCQVMVHYAVFTPNCDRCVSDSLALINQIRRNGFESQGILSRISDISVMVKVAPALLLASAIFKF